jgi:hypothetical protein
MRAVGTFVRNNAIGVTALFLALGGTSYAVTGTVKKSDEGNTLYACVTPKYHTMNLSSKNAKCPNGAKKISFNAKGATGAAGVAGAAGAAGAKGEKGDQGAAGAKGADGAQGPAGPSVFGSPGRQGEQGLQGEKGDKGDTGAAGEKGDVGPIGPTGENGAKGDTGDAGAAGSAGAAGAKGDKGDTGSAGSAGAKGDKGDAGSAGSAGAKGDQGLQGLIGLTGAKGDKGDAGAAGAKGDKGDPGATGAKGDKGDKGDPGVQGPPGASGGGIHLVDGNNVTLGTVMTSDRDSATVLTSTGYQIDIPFNGVFKPAQIYYTGSSCSGTAYLNDGGGGNGPFGTINAKWVVYSGTQNTLMAPATVANGVSTGEAFTAATIDNPTCGAAAYKASGWKLTAVSRATVGLPATIATPLKLQ